MIGLIPQDACRAKQGQEQSQPIFAQSLYSIFLSALQCVYLPRRVKILASQLGRPLRYTYKLLMGQRTLTLQDWERAWAGLTKGERTLFLVAFVKAGASDSFQERLSDLATLGRLFAQTEKHAA